MPDIRADALVVGGGPAGLMAAQQIAEAGHSVVLCDAMPAVGRKFLRAGVGGLNLTHAEPGRDFLTRYSGSVAVADWLQDFDAESVRAWAGALGIDTFVGSSGRVFPVQMKASPLLRAWLAQLRHAGVDFRMRHRWLGWEHSDGQMLHRFATPDGEQVFRPRVCVLALGGASWSRLGSDGRWRDIMQSHNIAVAEFLPSNGGVEVQWSPWLQTRFAGTPLKTIALRVAGSKQPAKRGEAILTHHGLEGGLVYALSAEIRAQLLKSSRETLVLDLLPDLTDSQIRQRLASPQGKMSLSNYLRKRLGLEGIKLALLRELASDQQTDTVKLALAAKHLTLNVSGMRPMDEAISTAGGIHGSELKEDLMLAAQPGLFCAGEMLDWDAPTGGYLLTAVFASGLRAGRAAVRFLA